MVLGVFLAILCGLTLTHAVLVTLLALLTVLIAAAVPSILTIPLFPFVWLWWLKVDDKDEEELDLSKLECRLGVAVGSALYFILILVMALHPS